MGRPSFTFSDHEYVEIEAELPQPANALSADADPIVLLRPEGDWDRPGVLDKSADRPATNPHKRRCIGFDDKIVDRDLDRTDLVDPLAQSEQLLDVDVRRQIEMRDGLFGLRQAPGDRRAHAI